MKRKAEGKSVNQRESGGAYEICYETKLKALELFRSGCGYKKVSKELGLKVYTVRDWGRSSIRETANGQYQRMESLGRNMTRK